MQFTRFCSLTAAAILLSLPLAAFAQKPSAAKPSQDPGKLATQPLTPKSAMSTTHKSNAGAPGAARRTNASDAELSHLERQNVRSTPQASPAPKAPPIKSSTSSPKAAPGSQIKANYQKPSGGIRANVQGANTPNSRTPRVSQGR